MSLNYKRLQQALAEECLEGRPDSRFADNLSILVRKEATPDEMAEAAFRVAETITLRAGEPGIANRFLKFIVEEV